MTSSTETSAWIVDADEATFEKDVVERSRQTLVVLDFWASWCQPCRLLGPILEKLAREYDGKFLLVKAETEKTPRIAGSFGVDSIPAVYAMRDAQLLDYFVGLKSEDQVRAWLDRLLPGPAETLVAEGRTLESTDAQAAEARYREASTLDPALASAKIALASLFLTQGRNDESRAIVDELETRGFLEADAEKLKAQLNLAGQAETAVDLNALRSAVAANPKDLSSKLHLAEALAAQGDHQEALELALGIVQSGKKELVDPARALMIDIFRLLPEDSPLTLDYRRRLSTAMS